MLYVQFTFSRYKDLKIEENFRKHKRSSRNLWNAPKTSVFEFTDRLCVPETNEYLSGITGRFEFNCELKCEFNLISPLSAKIFEISPKLLFQSLRGNRQV